MIEESSVGSVGELVSNRAAPLRGQALFQVRPPDGWACVQLIDTTPFAERQSFRITRELDSVKNLISWPKPLHLRRLRGANPWHDPRFSVGHN
jgi:hypothetical protein